MKSSLDLSNLHESNWSDCVLITQHNRGIRTEAHAFGDVFSWNLPSNVDIINQTALAALQLDDALLFEEAVVEIKENPSSDLFKAIQTSVSRLGLNSLICGTNNGSAAIQACQREVVSIAPWRMSLFC
jgi:hypothetical protein